MAIPVRALSQILARYDSEGRCRQDFVLNDSDYGYWYTCALIRSATEAHAYRKPPGTITFNLKKHATENFMDHGTGP